MDYNQEKEKKNPTDGMVGIRQTLRDMGFSDNRIGYNEKTNTVTLDGKNLMTPGYLDSDAGVSYASKGDIQKSVVNLYKDTANPVVRVSDAYASASGPYGLTADALTYGNGTVSVGGKPISVLYIDDEGKAWARQNTVTDAVRSYINQSQVESPNKLAEYYREKYLSEPEKILSGLSQREEFSYDPESDPVFQAYRNKYQLEGERAGREAISDMASLTGGYASSAAVTAGAQARQYYAKKLTDVIPELAQQAFDRYVEKYQADLDLADQMIRLYDKVYGNALSANQKQKENVNTVALSNVERDRKEKDESRENFLYGLEQEKGLLQNQELSLSNLEKATRLDYYEDMLREEVKKGILSNREAQIYLDYYEQLLDEELTGMSLDNQIKASKI